MDALIVDQAEELAKSLAGKATTLAELNGLMHTAMKSALERMLGAELNVDLREQQAAGESVGEGVTDPAAGQKLLARGELRGNASAGTTGKNRGAAE